MSPLLIITPTLGQSRFLEETVRSVKDCPATHIHLIVAPTAAVKSLQLRFPDARIVVSDEPGMYSALNAGLAAASDQPWEWFTYINDDDCLHGKAVAQVMENRPLGTDVQYGRVDLIDSNSSCVGEIPVARTPGDLLDALCFGIVPLAQPGTLIHRNVLQQLSGFDPAYRAAGDLDFFVRALVHGANFRFVARRLAAFRLHPGQISKDEHSVRLERDRALASLAGRNGRRTAVWRFRAGNLGVYFKRVARFGLVRMERVYRTS